MSQLKDSFVFLVGDYKLEKIEDAAIRKAKEETNLDCKFDKIISIEETIFEKSESMLTLIHTLNICCLMNVDSIKSDEFHASYKWIDKIEIDFHDGVKNPLLKLGYKI